MIAEAYAPWDRRKVKRHASERQRTRNNWRAMAERRRLRGLTTRGTVPRRQLEARLILADVDALAAALAACYHDLTGPAQARVLQLETRLAAVRKLIV